jgi:hypothetical protein
MRLLMGGAKHHVLEDLWKLIALCAVLGWPYDWRGCSQEGYFLHKI